MGSDDHQRDVGRALEACKAIVDGRDPSKDSAAILVTAEHAFSVLLLATCGGNPRLAAAMLNEGLVQGIEERLSLWNSKGGRTNG